MALNFLQRLIFPVIKTPAEKMDFIHAKTFNYYLQEFKKQEDSKRSRENITIPYFIVEENLRKLAFQKANNDLADVIEQCRIDECYKKALKASGNKPSYEVNYNLNLLKRLIGGFNFNRQRYTGDKIDIKQMFVNSMSSFKALDGTLFKEHEEKNKVELTQEEKSAMAKEAIEKGAQGCIAAIRIYEPIWRETYAEMVKFMQENPIAPQQEGQANA